MSSLFQFGPDGPSGRRSSLGHFPRPIRPDAMIQNRAPLHMAQAAGHTFGAVQNSIVGTVLGGGLFLGAAKGLGGIARGAGRLLRHAPSLPRPSIPRGVASRAMGSALPKIGFGGMGRGAGI